MKNVIWIVIIIIGVFYSLMTESSWGAEFCVSDAAGLQTALTTAQSNGQNDTIKIVRGSYSGHFTYNSSDGRSIDLFGGYATGCTSRVVDPLNTVLDGAGTGRVLYVYNSNAGEITIDGLTIQNGLADGAGSNGFGGGAMRILIRHQACPATSTSSTPSSKEIPRLGPAGGVYAQTYSDSGTVSPIVFQMSVITGNSNGSYGGGVAAYSVANTGTAGDIIFSNNTITGNRGTWGGGVYAEIHKASGTQTGTLTITNNTITGNRADSGGGVSFLVYNIINVYNNIIRGNTASSAADIDIGYTGTANGYTNNYASTSGGWDNAGGNINADPQFVDPGRWDDNGTPADASDDTWVNGDYHLLSTSPSIDTGTDSAPQRLGTDFDGNSRIIDGDWNGTATVDMGCG